MFGRRTASTGSTAVSVDTEQSKIGGKGRATPTRKEAEAARKQRLTPPKGRKQLAARQREQTKASRAQVRAAMETGDDRYLPTRDRGPVRKFVRDYVDSRRTVGQYLLPAFFVIFVVASLAREIAAYSTYVWFAVIALMITDAVRLTRGVKAGIHERFPDAETKGISLYAVMRGWQMRRLRLPKPQVTYGARI